MIYFYLSLISHKDFSCVVVLSYDDITFLFSAWNYAPDKDHRTV